MEQEDLKKLEETKQLNARQEKFCQEYVSTACLNATKAYMAVYPNCKYDTAKVSASQLLTNPNVKKRVDELKAEMIIKYDLKKEQLLHMALWVVEHAQEGIPEVKLNRDGKFVPTGNKIYDYKAINDSIKNMASMLGFNVQQVKAEVQADVKEDVNIVTAKDIATELMKK